MTDEQVAEQTQAIGPGQMLRDARTAKGLTVDDVANRLNLKSSNVQDLEAEKFDERISVTFIRGYYKNYAKLLDVPQAEILQAFDALNAAKQEPAKLQSFSRKMAKQASDDRLMMVSYVILAIILAMVVVWWLQQSNTTTADSLPGNTTNTSESVVSSPAQETAPETAPETLEASQPQVMDTEPTEPVDLERIEPEPAPTETQAENTAASETEPQETLPEQVELVFQFSADCWVNILDATGEAIAYGVKKAGRTMPVSGVPPFEVTLGAPDVVQIRYNGEAVDMAGFPKGRTAKFNLPLN